MFIFFPELIFVWFSERWMNTRIWTPDKKKRSEIGNGSCPMIMKNTVFFSMAWWLDCPKTLFFKTPSLPAQFWTNSVLNCYRSIAQIDVNVTHQWTFTPIYSNKQICKLYLWTLSCSIDGHLPQTLDEGIVKNIFLLLNGIFELDLSEGGTFSTWYPMV